MNSNQARSELDAAISRLDTQCDIMSIRLGKSGGISKGSVRVVTEAANRAVAAYYDLVNAEKHEREAEARRVAVEACQRRSGVEKLTVDPNLNWGPV